MSTLELDEEFLFAWVCEDLHYCSAEDVLSFYCMGEEL